MLDAVSLNDAKSLQQERIQMFHNVYDGIIPKRVPIEVGVGFELAAQYGNVNVFEAQWKPSLVREAADKICNTIYSDGCPFMGTIRFPSFYAVLNSQSYKMGANGFIQHPDVIGMLLEDYDYLIENPYNCMLERIIPRHHKALDLNNPMQLAITLLKSYQLFNSDAMEGGMVGGEMIEKYGYFSGGMMASGGMTSAPFDFLSDQLRSFKGISMDVKRIPQKVNDACEALYPILLQKGMPSKIEQYSTVGNPLHMPTFMREKDFKKLWWPTFKRQADEYASMGVKMSIFCEDDWERYLDYLYELPTNTIIMFEYGDPKLIKEKIGEKHIITGLYPMTLLKTGTKQQCIDKAKELIDILAPGGKYIFGLDKSPLTLNDINIENLAAVSEYVRDNAIYNNPGKASGMVFNKADYKVEQSRKFESKYFKTWERFKEEVPDISELGKCKLQSIEQIIFQYMMFLLV